MLSVLKIIYSMSLLTSLWQSTFGLFLGYATLLWWKYFFFYIFFKNPQGKGFLIERKPYPPKNIQRHRNHILADLFFSMRNLWFFIYAPLGLYFSLVLGLYVFGWLREDLQSQEILHLLNEKMQLVEEMLAYFYIVSTFSSIFLLCWLLKNFHKSKKKRKMKKFCRKIIYHYFPKTLYLITRTYGFEGLEIFLCTYLFVMVTFVLFMIVLFSHNLGFFGPSLEFFFGPPFANTTIYKDF